MGTVQGWGVCGLERNECVTTTPQPHTPPPSTGLPALTARYLGLSKPFILGPKEARRDNHSLALSPASPLASSLTPPAPACCPDCDCVFSESHREGPEYPLTGRVRVQRSRQDQGEVGAGGATPREHHGWMLAGRFTSHLGPLKVRKALEARVGPAQRGLGVWGRVGLSHCANWHLGPSGQKPAK